MLTLQDVEVTYGKLSLALKGVSIEVPDGSIVALVGANGAGKTTTLKAICGLLGAERGEVSGGTIHQDALRLDRLPPADIVRAGIAVVPEGRQVFAGLSVQENLWVGAHIHADRKRTREDLDRMFSMMPILGEKRNIKAGLLSGGQQQMVALARALMARPRMLLLDEPSLGLAPVVVQEVFSVIQQLNRDNGLTVLLVEQNVALSLRVAHRGYILESGRVVLHGSAAELLANEDVRELYLGIKARAAGT